MSSKSGATNVFWHEHAVTKAERVARTGHKSAVIWLTGLSGSGKSTIANELDHQLFKRGVNSYVLDGDNVRHGLNKDLGFSPEDRVENIRRIGEVAKLMAGAGFVVITAFISPYRADRELVRELLEPDEFIEVFVDCPLEVCEERDTKGLYKKARAGEIPEFTGISAPYETPENGELTIDANAGTPTECAERLVAYLDQHILTP